MTIVLVPSRRVLFAAVVTATTLFFRSSSVADESYTPFDGSKSSWHEGFDRYDYLIDEASLEIQPFQRDEREHFGVADPPPGKRRCIVVVPWRPAFGNPWSWQGCYWDHQPQVEIELLKRGFHVAYVSANANLKPDKTWDAWYAFLTERHGLSKTPNFVGMSRGGEYAYTWATTHPTKVSCIYADNPGINPEALARLHDLAAADVPLLHVCGSIDPLLGRSSSTIETIYQQFGGRISVMIKEGAGHHPHSLTDPTPIADFISQQAQQANKPAPPYLSGRITRSSFYGLGNSYRYFPAEGRYITCRGPWFMDSFNRYSFELAGVEGSINVIEPRTAAPGKPWVFRADYVSRDATVDLALLAAGFHIVTGPVPYNADGPSLKSWNAVYELLTKNGFAKKPVLEGVGGAAGEAYAWAIANPDKVSCLYAENPLLRCTMTKAQPLDGLAALAKAGVPVLHVCGALDPFRDSDSTAAKKRYEELGGHMTVLVEEGQGHFSSAPRDPAAAVEFIARHLAAKRASRPESALNGPQEHVGRYFQVDYPASTVAGELPIAVTYTIWIPDGAKRLRGVIVHQHGAGTTASIEGGTAAYDLHWQALAKKWNCGLLGPSYHVKHEQNDLSPGGSERWFDPRHGSEKTFLKALDDLATASNHPELARVPWVLWGHSGGGIWAEKICAHHPERVVAMWLRSGSAAIFRTHPEFVQPQIPEACYAIPIMINPGVKEEKTNPQNPPGYEKGPWWGNLATFREYRQHGGLIGFAPDPRTGHECGDSRYLAIPFFNACLAARLPDDGDQSAALKPMPTSSAWLAPLLAQEAVPAADFHGKVEESVWLPDESVAKAWMEYVKTGAVGDMTPPPSPYNVKATPDSNRGVEITWNADADLENGLRGFVILRDGAELATLPEKPNGVFGRPLFQGMTYHDTPVQPLATMHYVDSTANPGEKHAYAVISVNSVGLKSAPSEPTR
jgi:pimeloyl-ACP methyl ester carboxylesterase